MRKISSEEVQEKKHFNDIAGIYDDNYHYSEQFVQYKIDKKVREFVTSIKNNIYSNKNLKFLEIGCGTGEYTKKVAAHFSRSNIVGLDIAENVIRLAKKKCRGLSNVSFDIQSIYGNDLKNESFDVVYGFYALHHMNIDKVLKESYRILKPGGIVYFCEPNILNPVVYLIKSNKYLKKAVGDSPDEWAINPLTISKNNKYFKILKVSLSEYIVPTRFLKTSLLKKIDKFTENFKKVPLVKYLGGSTQVLLQKTGSDSESRHMIERNFHDAWAKNINPHEINFKEAFNAQTAVENLYALEKFGDIKGKKILDLGCGMGDASVYFASRGAEVYAVDISPEMIKLVMRLAKLNGFGKLIHAKVMAAEKLNFKNNYFDYVFGNGVLHHVDYDVALGEVWHILRKEGTAIFVEPLAHNPVINLYRKIADKVRTPTETPLEYQNLNKLSSAKFSKSYHHEFHLFTLLIFLWFYLIEKTNPNKERYWKKIIDDSEKIKIPFTLLNKIDNLVFYIFPFLRKFAWNTVLIYEK